MIDFLQLLPDPFRLKLFIIHAFREQSLLADDLAFNIVLLFQFVYNLSVYVVSLSLVLNFYLMENLSLLDIFQTMEILNDSKCVFFVIESREILGEVAEVKVEGYWVKLNFVWRIGRVLLFQKDVQRECTEAANAF